MFKHPKIDNLYLTKDGQAILMSGDKLVRKSIGITDSKGYRILNWNGKKHKMHRLVYEAVTGKALDNIVCSECMTIIDHIDGNRQNNNFSNLRVTSIALNASNRAQNLQLPYSVVRVVYKNKKGTTTRYKAKVYMTDVKKSLQGPLRESVIEAISDRNALMESLGRNVPEDVIERDLMWLGDNK